MSESEAICKLLHAYDEILFAPKGTWDSHVWARTLGTLHMAKSRVIADSIAQHEIQRQDALALLAQFRDNQTEAT